MPLDKGVVPSCDVTVVTVTPVVVASFARTWQEFVGLTLRAGCLVVFPVPTVRVF